MRDKQDVKCWGPGLSHATPMREGARLRSEGGLSQRPSPPVCGDGRGPREPRSPRRWRLQEDRGEEGSAQGCG